MGLHVGETLPTIIEAQRERRLESAIVRSSPSSLLLQDPEGNEVDLMAA